MQPICTVGLVSYKRPLFLAECIRSMHRNPGMPFDLLLHSNDLNNEGSYALEKIFKQVKTKYFVVVEEDELWFQDNWLKNLVEAFEQKPDITEEGLKMGYKNEWGILASNTLGDTVNPPAKPEHYEGLIRFTKGNYTYWTNIHAGGGVMIFKTDVLRKLNPFGSDSCLNGGLYPIIRGYEKAKYPQGRVENIYIYHAFSPYWNSLYPEVFKEKQKGQTIEEAKQFFNVDYTNKFPMQMLKYGKFDEYVKEVYSYHRK